jgi:hypothetical protein
LKGHAYSRVKYQVQITMPSITNHPSSLLRQVFRVDREEIGYLRFTLESYDGMAVVATLDPYAALIEVSISRGCEETVLQLLEALRQEEGLHIEIFKPM